MRSVAVYAVPDDPVGDRVMAALELTDPTAFDPGRRSTRSSPPRPTSGTKWLPAFVRLSDELPKLASMKIDDLTQARIAATGAVPAAGSVAELLYTEHGRITSNSALRLVGAAGMVADDPVSAPWVDRFLFVACPACASAVAPTRSNATRSPNVASGFRASLADEATISTLNRCAASATPGHRTTAQRTLEGHMTKILEGVRILEVAEHTFVPAAWPRSPTSAPR